MAGWLWRRDSRRSTKVARIQGSRRRRGGFGASRLTTAAGIHGSLATFSDSADWGRETAAAAGQFARAEDGSGFMAACARGEACTMRGDWREITGQRETTGGRDQKRTRGASGSRLALLSCWDVGRWMLGARPPRGCVPLLLPIGLAHLSLTRLTEQ